MSAPKLVTPDHRTLLWESMLDADGNVGYWTLISDRYTAYDKCFKVVLAVSSSGTVAAWHFWAAYPIYWKALSGLATVAAIIYPVLCPADKLKRISGLVTTWREVLINYELLWHQDSDLSSTKLWAQFENTKRREAKIDEGSLPKIKKLITQAFTQVMKKRGLGS